MPGVSATDGQYVSHTLWTIEVILQVFLIIMSFQSIQHHLEYRVHISDILGYLFNGPSSVRYARNLNHCELLDGRLELQTEDL